MKPITYHFWISNISNIDVHLNDLGLIIKSRQHMNLLDARYHSYTVEELIASAKNGSLFRKKDKVVIRKLPPVKEEKILEKDSTAWNPGIITPRPLRSAVKLEETYYEELDLTDDKYAEEASELTDK